MMRQSLGAAAALALVTSIGPRAAAAPPHVYVADERSGTVSVLDAATFRRVAIIPVGVTP